MTQYVVWDIETDQADTSYCTILELAAIWLDNTAIESVAGTSGYKHRDLSRANKVKAIS